MDAGTSGGGNANGGSTNRSGGCGMAVDAGADASVPTLAALIALAASIRRRRSSRNADAP
jgi:MYXO-CTERM domain-containing protein